MKRVNRIGLELPFHHRQDEREKCGMKEREREKRGMKEREREEKRHDGNGGVNC